MNKCIECSKEFEPYLTVVECHVCQGECFIETDNDMMISDFKRCWQCNGKGMLKLTEKAFCNEFCREEHFENND